MMAAELSIKYKDQNGALGAWALRFFGSPAARNTTLWVVLMQCSTAAFVSEVTATYIDAYWPGVIVQSDDSMGLKYGKQLSLTLLIILASAIINLSPLERVSGVMWVFSINAALAFLALVIQSLRKISAEGWGSALHRFDNPLVTGKTINWSELINLLIYNSAGYDASASIIEHVVKPHVNVPAAMLAVGLTIAALYVAALTFPYLASHSTAGSWQSGFFVTVAREISGEWLATWVFISCILTNVQVYISALLTASRTIQGMSALGVFGSNPQTKSLSHLDARGTPRAAIAVCAVLSFLFGCAPLLVNLSVESILYVFIMLAEIAIFLRDDSARSTFAAVAGTKMMRRAWTSVPLILSVWVLLVQDRRVALPTLTLILATMLWTIPEYQKREPPGQDIPMRESKEIEL